MIDLINNNIHELNPLTAIVSLLRQQYYYEGNDFSNEFLKKPSDLTKLSKLSLVNDSNINTQNI